MQTVSIVIPAYNEEKTIQLLLDRVFDAALPESLEREVILVDDCSRDMTARRIRQYMEVRPECAIRYIRHETNQGKGGALHTGIQAATGDFILIQDADLEYDPDEYAKLLTPILNNKADVVFGSRFMGGDAHRVLFFWHSVGNRFLTLLSNMFSDLNLTDMETCYKVFRSSILKSLILEEKRFGFEPEVTAKVARVPGVRIYEVGISYYGRTYAEGKKINWKDGFRAIYCILKYNVFSRNPLPSATELYRETEITANVPA